MKFILKLLAAPVILALNLFVRICAFLLARCAFLFQIAGAILSLMALVLMLTGAVKNGLFLLLLAFLASPIGLPMLAAKALGGLQSVGLSLKGFLCI